MAGDKKEPTILSQNCAEAKDTQARGQLGRGYSEIVGWDESGNGGNDRYDEEPNDSCIQHAYNFWPNCTILATKRSCCRRGVLQRGQVQKTRQVPCLGHIECISTEGHHPNPP